MRIIITISQGRLTMHSLFKLYLLFMPRTVQVWQSRGAINILLMMLSSQHMGHMWSKALFKRHMKKLLLMFYILTWKWDMFLPLTVNWPESATCSHRKASWLQSMRNLMDIWETIQHHIQCHFKLYQWITLNFIKGWYIIHFKTKSYADVQELVCGTEELFGGHYASFLVQNFLQPLLTGIPIICLDFFFFFSRILLWTWKFL